MSRVFHGRYAPQRWAGPRASLGRVAGRAEAGEAASTGRRAAAFAVDALGSGLIARLVDPIDTTGTVSIADGVTPVAVLAVVTIVGLLLAGTTPGMWLFGLRVVRLDDGGRPGLVPAALRTALLVLLVPAVITDRDGRGLHDRAAGTVVVRPRP